MKRILTLLLVSLSLMTYGQIQTTLPTGSKAYGSTTYIAPDGILWYGTAPLKWRGVYPSTKVDSLLALIPIFDASLYYTKVASDARFYPLSTNPAGYLTSFTEVDPTVPAYAKTLSAFSVIKTSTDALYPTLTGGGASGTWNINVLGNAETVTNGVYSTGSYANPSWITSLAYSKLTGAPNLGDYVDRTTAQSIAGIKTFTDNVVIDQSTFIAKATLGSDVYQSTLTGDNLTMTLSTGTRLTSLSPDVGLLLKTRSGGSHQGINLKSDNVTSNVEVQFQNGPGTLAYLTDIPSLAGYELLANKQNSLVTDGTGVKYPTVDAVNANVVKLTTDQTVNGVKSFGDVVNMVKGGQNTSPSTADYSFLANRIFNQANVSNGYAYYDANVFTKNYDDASYAAYSSNTEFGGTHSINHFNAFQARANWNNTDTIINYRAFVDDNFISSGSGKVANRISFHSSGGSNAGHVGNWYGLKVDNPPLTPGTVDKFYPIWIQGGESFLGDQVTLLQDYTSTNGGFFRSYLQAASNEFETSLGTNGATGVGILTFGNRGTNEIRLGRNLTGGYLDVYVNNTVGPLSASDGTKAFSISTGGVVGASQIEPISGGLILGYTAPATYLGSGGHVTINSSGKLNSDVAPTTANDVVRLTDLSTYAPLASPALTGTPTAPTPTAGDNSTKLATTAFVFGNTVTTTGNQTGIAGDKSFTGDIVGNGFYTGAVGSDQAFMLSSAVYVGNTSTGKTIQLSNGGIDFGNTSFGVTLLPTTLTATRTILLPDASGTTALTSDIAAYANALTVTDATAVSYTKVTLNSTYPSAPILFKVVCPTIATVYQKYDSTNWFSQAIVILP